MGSVTNGYESIAGQINYEIKKPFSDMPFFLICSIVLMVGLRQMHT